MSEAKLYLMPSTMSDGDWQGAIPAANVEIARRVKHYVVENVRTVRRFLRRCDRTIDIDSIEFTVLDEHTRREDVAAMLAPLEAGHDMAVVSEAGCPAVADPGAELVAAAQRRGFEVVPLVGPSSIIMALMGSGMNGQSFAFAGYLPVEAGARTARLREMERRIRREGQTQIFIETPYRNNRLIAELARTLPGEMMLTVASDITGPQQTVVTRPLKQWRTATADYDKRPTIFVLGQY